MAGAVAVVAGGVVVVIRLEPPVERFMTATLFGAALLTSVFALSRQRPVPGGVLGHAGFALLAVFAYPALLLAVVVASMVGVPVAGAFTALAGNPPVNSADSDVFLAAAGVVAGLAFGIGTYLATLASPARGQGADPRAGQEAC